MLPWLLRSVSKKLPDPEKLVAMGRISAPFGIKGWIRVQPFGGPPNPAQATGGLTNYSAWWVEDAQGWRQYEIEQSQEQGTDVIAKLKGCDDRDVAAGLKGRQVAVPRADFPLAEPGEFYWADLLGLSVKNTEGLVFGVVTAMLETGANAVMVVQAQQSAMDGDSMREKLIPFIADVVKRVDIAAGVIEVQWGADY